MVVVFVKNLCGVIVSVRSLGLLKNRHEITTFLNHNLPCFCSTFSAANSTTPSTAGIIPGSEDLNSGTRFSTIQVRILAFLNLLLAVVTFCL